MKKNLTKITRIAAASVVVAMLLTSSVIPSSKSELSELSELSESPEFFEIALPAVPLNSSGTRPAAQPSQSAQNSGTKTAASNNANRNSKKFTIPVPSSPGTEVMRNDSAFVDYSNAKDGYVVVRYRKPSKNVLLTLVDAPGGERYTYVISPETHTVLPLSEGDGTYTIGIYEQVAGGKFRLVITQKVDAKLENQQLPFLTPNQLVNFSEKSNAVRRAAQLTEGKTDFLEIIGTVYNFVIKNVEYDNDLAKTVQSGYVPNIDAVLKRKSGICFDYAALMAAMLRSQGIPTKLVIGFVGEEYHAWLNVYSDETGWINQVILFDGKTWRLMDPTFAAGRPEFLVDEKDYEAKYQY